MLTSQTALSCRIGPRGSVGIHTIQRSLQDCLRPLWLKGLSAVETRTVALKSESTASVAAVRLAVVTHIEIDIFEDKLKEPKGRGRRVKNEG